MLLQNQTAVTAYFLSEQLLLFTIAHKSPLSLTAFNPFSAGTFCIRQNLTSVDVRFRRIKTVPALKEVKYL